MELTSIIRVSNTHLFVVDHDANTTASPGISEANDPSIYVTLAFSCGAKLEKVSCKVRTIALPITASAALMFFRQTACRPSPATPRGAKYCKQSTQRFTDAEMKALTLLVERIQ